ncbi:MAG TPA: glycoside hydrolase family 9 protein [Burkholderiaceae bacterium]|nr:glycoside hydrolase family 9 protein [Burkholderiaceae bacterium]
MGHRVIGLFLAAWAGVAPAGEAAPPPAPAVIAVNQVGYLPGGAKGALLWGVRGEEVRLVEAAGGGKVWQASLGPAAEWPAAGRKVQTIDFSAFTRPGRYRLQVDEGPVSDEFVIGADAYAALSAAALKAFYFNRAGIELKPEHAGPWARPAGHPDTQVRVHASAVGPGRPEGTLISAPRGWYDAGDYNKYVVNSGIAVYTLLAAWEHFPAFFQAQRLNLPETGNGLPDLLNEVAWNLDWMLAMQDPGDGGVYHKLTNADFDGMVMPHQATGPRWVVGKSTAAALDFAAVAATASRVFRAFDAQRPGYAARLLAAARAAWAWAQAHPDVAYRQPPDIHTGEYGDSQLADEFAWAAAELYITTRDDRFWVALKPTQTAMTVPAWAEVQGLGWISLAHHRAGLTAAADPGLIASRVSGLASRLAEAWQAAPERLGLQAGDYIWGSQSAVLNRAMVLIQGYRLTGTRAQLDAAQALLDNVLGRNALALCGVTGFGTRSPRHPHHRPSEADGVAEPVPGFLVGGPNAGRQDAQHCPMPYPSTLPAQSYLDHACSYASNEVAINWNAPLVYVSAALQVLTP